MNYIQIEDVKINLTDEQVKQLKEGLSIREDTRLSEIAVGDTFQIGEYEFIVLEQLGDTTAVILKDLLIEKSEFSKTDNNYKDTLVDCICSEFEMRLSDIIGDTNIIEHTVDLTADDGLKCYGSIRRRVSLLTAEQYRKYVYILDKYKIDKWWWLATAHSTSKHTNEYWVKCVSPDGNIYDDNYFNSNGVRPFLNFVSSIFVSCEE